MFVLLTLRWSSSQAFCCGIRYLQGLSRFFQYPSVDGDTTVIANPLLIALILALVGCSSAPKTTALPEEQQEQPKAQETEPQVRLFGITSLGVLAIQDRGSREV